MKKSELRKIIREVLNEQRMTSPGRNQRDPSIGLPSLKGLRDKRNLERIIRNMRSEQEFVQWYNSTILPYGKATGVGVPTSEQLIMSVTGGASSLTEWIKAVRWFNRLVNRVTQILEGVNSTCCQLGWGCCSEDV